MSMDTLTEQASKPRSRTPMTPARRVTLAVGLPVLFVLIGWTGLSVVADVGTGTYQFSRALPDPGGKLTANLGEGDVTLVPGNSARLTGTLTYSLIRPDVTIHGSSVSYRCLMPAGQCWLNSTLSVPAGDDVNLSSGDGDLTVNGGIAGNMSLSTGAGDLTANGLAGQTARLSTTAGDITASGITASEVTVSSIAGNITLTFARVPDHVTVNSNVGDITIVVPSSSIAYKVVTSAGIGNTSVGVPQAASSSHEIDVSSTTGDISITTGPSFP